jgi:CheY-like chemotaxis protein
MGHHILVVDDDAAMQQMMEMMLTDAGYQATTVGTLQAALDILERTPPDLLITDVRLHGYNGLQLLATSAEPIPAIVITGSSDKGLEAEARRYGAAYLPKSRLNEALLPLVAEKLAGIDRPDTRTPPRRWPRKRVTEKLPASISGLPVRILEVSHGGVRFEFERAPGPWLPLSFTIDLPTWYSSIGIDVVWKSRAGDSRWLCGAAVSDNRPAWREIVDAMR